MYYSAMKYTLLTLVLLFNFYITICISQYVPQPFVNIADTPEIIELKKLQPFQSKSPRIMFWRPQKVGSSTLLSIFISYGFRFNELPRRKSVMNSYCKYMDECYVQNHDLLSNNTLDDEKKISLTRHINSDNVRQKVSEKLARRIPYRMSLTHEICNEDARDVYDKLKCGFDVYDYKPTATATNNLYNLFFSSNQNNPIVEDLLKEIFLVRNPLDRAISIYYFWGELYTLKALNSHNSKKSNMKHSRHHLGMPGSIGKATAGEIKGAFTYHGNESSVPDESIAIEYGKRLPLAAGMPGPSYTWSLFANNLQDCLTAMQNGNVHNRIMSLVTERLDESLVVMMHYLNNEFNTNTILAGGQRDSSKKYWTLADIVYVTNRKAQSPHPKHQEWPPSAITLINDTLIKKGEYVVYDTANQMLDMRIDYLKKHKSVAFEEEVNLFKSLKKRVSELCLTPVYLSHYKSYLESSEINLAPHTNHNRLRDVENKYSDEGHDFDFQKQILYSFDLCGSCEAHGLLLYHQINPNVSIEDSLVIKEFPDELFTTHIEKNIVFKKCPYELK